MKIRAKLILLIVGIVLLFGMAAALYFVLLSPVDRMQKERGYFSTLVDAIKDQQLAVNRLAFARLQDSSKDLQAADDKVQAAFQGLGKVTVLPKVSAKVKDALEIVGNLKALNDDRLAKLGNDFDTVTSDAKALFFFIDSVNPQDFYTAKVFPNKAKILQTSLQDLKTLMTDIDIMHDSLAASTDTITQQFTIIDHEIALARARALRTALLAILAIIAATVFGGIAFANTIARSVIGIERSIAQLKEGNLAERSRLSSRDEIGTLAQNLNHFLDVLATSILHIKETSAANIEAKDKLVEAAGEAMSSATQIESSTSSIGRQLETLDGRIDESSGSIRKIAAGITDLNTQIEGQSAMVEEATASVTEMLASLENMGKVTEKN
ncbi:MAG TPA: methyl-accepting chemotaxis protein, partial [Rectinemataceae bacterium]|nr:methyl-accepting chemotaxis protein [Rectinemataceae bacterium]